MLSLISILGPSLRVLDLSSCVALTSRTVQAICAHLSHLSVLRLAWCKELRDWGLMGLEDPSEEPALSAPGRGPWGQNPLPRPPVRATDGQEPERHDAHCGGPSLLALQGLQQLDLTACSQLTDASLAKVWGKEHGDLSTEEGGAGQTFLLLSFCHLCSLPWQELGDARGHALGSTA